MESTEFATIVLLMSLSSFLPRTFLATWNLYAQQRILYLRKYNVLIEARL